MRNQNEINVLLASRGLNTVSFQAFLIEAREPDSPFHRQIAHLGTVSNGELDGALKGVELAFKEWVSND